MKGWLFLVIAIVGEVIATSALKSSEGFTKLAPSAVVIIGYGIAFYFLSLVLKSIPVGVAYAVWSGLGVVIITAIAWLLHGQKLEHDDQRHGDQNALKGLFLFLVHKQRSSVCGAADEKRVVFHRFFGKKWVFHSFNRVFHTVFL